MTAAEVEYGSPAGEVQQRIAAMHGAMVVGAEEHEVAEVVDAAAAQPMPVVTFAQLGAIARLGAPLAHLAPAVVETAELGNEPRRTGETVAFNKEFRTLGGAPRVNIVTDVRPDGLYVHTVRSVGRESGPQLVPAWMFELAWSYLVTHGELTNTTLLNELRVYRSSAVCAILARLPDVEAVAGREIRLRWRGSADSGLGRAGEPA